MAEFDLHRISETNLQYCKVLSKGTNYILLYAMCVYVLLLCSLDWSHIIQLVSWASTQWNGLHLV